MTEDRDEDRQESGLDGSGASLADSAASWVPPWSRPASELSDPASDVSEPASEGAALASDAPEPASDAPEPAASDVTEAAGDAEPADAELTDAELTDAEPADAELTDADEAVAADGADEDAGADSGGEDSDADVAVSAFAAAVDRLMAAADAAAAEEAAAEDSAVPPPPSELEADLAASWVPPWARAMPDLIIEPASDNPVSLDPWWTSVPEEAADGEAPAQAEHEPHLADGELRAALEAILLVVDEPVGEVALAQVLEEPTDRIGTVLRQLAEEYAAQPRGFELRHAAGGWRLYTRPDYAQYVERFILDGQSVRLTQAALETLAVVAYKQPVTRSRVSAIRGVNCDGVLKTLVGRGLVEEAGTESETGAHLYRTTSLFLEKLGINSTEELPGLAPFLPDNIDEIDSVGR